MTGAKPEECAPAKDATPSEQAEGQCLLEMRGSLEDLPAGMLQEGLKALTRHCLTSAVRLSTASKTLFCHFAALRSWDGELEAQLLEEQERYIERQNALIQRRREAFKKYVDAFYTLVQCGMRLPTLFVACTAGVMAVSVWMFFQALNSASDLHLSYGIPAWLCPALVASYTVALVWVEIAVIVGSFSHLLRQNANCLVTSVMWIPSLIAVGLFTVTACLIVDLMKKSGRDWQKGLGVAVPVSLVALSMYVELIAFATWVHRDIFGGRSLAERGQFLHLCHLLCLGAVATFLVLYYWPLLKN